MAKKDVIESEEKIRTRVFQAVATDPALDGVALRVFLYLSAHLDYEGLSHVPQLELASALNRRKEHISRAIRRLLESGVILPGEKGSRASEWRLNPDYGK